MNSPLRLWQAGIGRRGRNIDSYTLLAMIVLSLTIIYPSPLDASERSDLTMSVPWNLNVDGGNVMCDLELILPTNNSAITDERQLLHNSRSGITLPRNIMSPQASSTEFILSRGDLAIVDFGRSDRQKFMMKLLSDIPAGTTLLFTDHAISSSVAVGTERGAFMLELEENLPCGTFLVFEYKDAEWYYAVSEMYRDINKVGTVLKSVGDDLQLGESGASSLYVYEVDNADALNHGTTAHLSESGAIAEVVRTIVGRTADPEAGCRVDPVSYSEDTGIDRGDVTHNSSQGSLRAPTECPAIFSMSDFCTSCTSCSAVTLDNPDVTAECNDLKIFLILDESGSIDASEASEVEAGVEAFIAALNCQGVQLAGVEFASSADFILDTAGGYKVLDNTLATAWTDYFDGNTNTLLAQGDNATYDDNANGVYTNYQAAYLAYHDFASRYGLADLLLFFTDGQPTAVYLDNTGSLPNYTATNNGYTTGCGGTGTVQPAEYENAAIIANQWKCAGTHMFFAAVDAAASNLTAIENISGTNEFDINSNTILTSDYAVGDFEDLVIGFQTFVSQLCPFDSEILTQDICPDATDGAIAISIPEGLTVNDYSWEYFKNNVSQGTGTDNTTFLLFDNLGVGNYRVEIDFVLGDGCIRTESFLDTINAGAENVEAEITATTDETCTPPYNDGTVTVNVTVGAEPYRIVIRTGTDPGDTIFNELIYDEALPYTVTNLPPDSYELLINDVNNCNSVSEEFVINPRTDCCPLACEVTLTGDDEVCPGAQSTFQAATVGEENCLNPTYMWTFVTNSSGASFVGATDGSSVTVQAGVCGSYSVQASITCQDCDELTCTSDVISVVDNTDPLISCSAGGLYECQESIPDPDISTVTASDDCTLNPVVAHVEDRVVAGVCDNDKTVYRSYKATDDCGNAAYCTQVFTIIDNTSPVISCPQGASYSCDDEIPDPDVGLVTVISNNCSGQTATVFWVQDREVVGVCADDKTVYRSYKAIDDCGNSSYCTQVFIINDTTAPVISCSEGATYECAESIPDPDISTVTVTSNNCAGQTATVTWVMDREESGDCADEKTVYRSYKATDDCGNTTYCTQVFVIDDNTGPVITCNEGAMYQCTESIPDPDVNSVIINSNNCSGQSATVTWVMDREESGDCENEKTVYRSYKATDDCGNTTYCTQVFEINDNTGPVISCSEGATYECAESIPNPDITSVTVTSNNCSGQTATVTWVMDREESGDCADEKTVYRSYKATDDCGNRTYCTQVFVIDDNTGPVITCNEGAMYQCAESIPAPDVNSVIVNGNNCSGQTATVVWVMDREVSGDCADEKTVYRSYKATDDCGNTTYCTQVFEINDNTGPVITCNEGGSYECAESIPDPDINSVIINSNNCADQTATVVWVMDREENGVCADEKTVYRSYKATDDCGNTTYCTQVFEVDDNTAPVISCPTGLSFECEESIPDPDPSEVTVISNNCTGQEATVAWVADRVESGGCQNDKTVYRSYRATDDCGNKSYCTQVITISDDSAPIISCPADATYECVENIPDPNTDDVSVFSNNCAVQSAVVTWVQDRVEEGICSNKKTVYRSYKATDDCGNTSYCTQTFTIDDTTPPVISCASGETFECEESIPDPDITTVTVTSNNCAGQTATVTWVMDREEEGGDCINEQTVYRSYKATDDCGNTTYCTQVFVIDDNTGPVISCSEAATYECAESIPDPDITTVSVTSNNCSGQTATVTWVMDREEESGNCADEKTVYRSYKATDDCGNTTYCTQVFVIDDNTGPVIICSEGATYECAESIPDPDITTVSVTSNNCSGQTATVTWVMDREENGDCADEKTVYRSYKATDDCGNTTYCTQIFIIDDETAPVISCPAGLSFECEEFIPDPDPSEVTVISNNCSGQEATVIWVADRVESGGCQNDKTVYRSYKATDDCGNASYCTQVFTVSDDSAPIISCPADATYECAESIPDPDVDAVSVFSNNCAVQSAQVTWVQDRVLEGSCDNNKTVLRSYKATDDCGNASYCTQTFTIDDTTPPVISCPAGQTFECEESIPAADPSAVSVISNNCDGQTAEVTWIQDRVEAGSCLNERMVYRSYKATDDCGNASFCTQVFTIDDNTAPVISCPADATHECAESIPDPDVNAVTVLSNNCAIEVAVISWVADREVSGSCNNNKTIYRSYKATDDCGNTSYCTQTFTINDITAPEISCPAGETYECVESVPDPDPSSVSVLGNNCTDNQVVVTWVGDRQSEGACPNETTIYRSYKATDDCGNTSYCTQVFTIDDNTPATIVCPIGADYECMEEIPDPNPDIVSVMGNCSDETIDVVHVMDRIADEVCANEKTVLRSYKATDDCGNVSKCTQVFNIKDKKAPEIVCPDDVTFDCYDEMTPPDIDDVIASDNCNNEVTITFVSDVSDGGFNPEIITRKYRATDECGNSAECEQKIYIIDNTPPSLVECAPIELNLECGVGIQAFQLQAVDNCGGEVLITFYDAPMLSTACTQVISRMYMAIDESGNVATCPQEITITDTKPPEMECPRFIDLECTEEVPAVDLSLIEATDVCSDVAVEFMSEESNGQICPEIITRWFKATDDCGNATICSQEIFIWDTEAPTVQVPDDITIECDEPLPPSNEGFASDACGLQEFTSEDFWIDGPCDANGTWIRTYRAVDQCGNSSSKTQKIHVIDTQPPWISAPQPVTISCDDSTHPDITGYATAWDNCMVNPDVTILAEQVLPLACPGEEMFIRVWIATDGCGNGFTGSRDVQVIYRRDWQKPELTIPDDTTINCGDELPEASASATDNCDDDPLIEHSDSDTLGVCPRYVVRTYTAEDLCGNIAEKTQRIYIDDNENPVLECPPDMTVSCDEPLPGNMASATDACSDVSIEFEDEGDLDGCAGTGVLIRTYTATDGCGNSVQCEQRITINDTEWPGITCPPDVTISCLSDSGPDVTGWAIAEDNCDPNPIVSIVSESIISSDACTTVIERVWTGIDACGNRHMEAQCPQLITIIDDVAPTVTEPEDVTLECNSELPAAEVLSASDDCSEVNSELLSDVEEQSEPQLIYLRTYRVFDECDNEVIVTQRFYFEDSTPPEVNCPAHITLQCEDGLPGMEATASDACGSVDLTFHDNMDGAFCPDDGVIVRTYTATDESGNTAACTQYITREDTEWPEIFCPEDVTLECMDSDYGPEITGYASAVDNCDPNPLVTVLIELTLVDEPCLKVIRRVWQATDRCGNGNTGGLCDQIITLEDSQAPVISQPEDVTLLCDDELPEGDPSLLGATDNCTADEELEVTWVDEEWGDSPCDEPNIRRVYTVSDGCGNASTCEQFFIRKTGVTLEASVYLQGAWLLSGLGEDIMATSLLDSGFIPMEQPYDMAPYGYNGDEEFIALPDESVDWVLLELVDEDENSMGMQAAMVLADGTIVDTAASEVISFNSVPPGMYFVRVHHRNHLDIESEYAVDFTDCEGSYDFVSDWTPGLDGEVGGMKQVMPGKYAMVAGDVDGDQRVSYNAFPTDASAILTMVGFATPNGAVLGYYKEDVTMDGEVRYNVFPTDPFLILLNVGFSTPNNVILGHLY